LAIDGEGLAEAQGLIGRFGGFGESGLRKVHPLDESFRTAVKRVVTGRRNNSRAFAAKKAVGNAGRRADENTTGKQTWRDERDNGKHRLENRQKKGSRKITGKAQKKKRKKQKGEWCKRHKTKRFASKDKPFQ